MRGRAQWIRKDIFCQCISATILENEMENWDWNFDEKKEMFIFKFSAVNLFDVIISRFQLE